MNHERPAELLALELYDELEQGERAELAQHLADCGPCTQLRRELQAGLGALRGEARLAADRVLESRIDAALVRERRRARLRLLPIVASFAAGALLSLLLSRGTDRTGLPAIAATPRASSTWTRFHVEEAPPPADSSGTLSRYPSYVRH